MWVRGCLEVRGEQWFAAGEAGVGVPKRGEGERAGAQALGGEVLALNRVRECPPLIYRCIWCVRVNLCKIIRLIRGAGAVYVRERGENSVQKRIFCTWGVWIVWWTVLRLAAGASGVCESVSAK